MDEAVEHFRTVLRGISTGRARSALLEHIQIEAYGERAPLFHHAWVGGSGGANTLRVQPHDRSLLGTIRKAIQKADLGLNPQPMGDALIVKVPSLDEEQRARLSARVKKLAEDQRVAVRNIRKDFRNRAKREKRLKEIQKPLEDLTKEKIAEIDALLDGKLDAINWMDPKWNK